MKSTLEQDIQAMKAVPYVNGDPLPERVAPDLYDERRDIVSQITSITSPNVDDLLVRFGVVSFRLGYEAGLLAGTNSG